MKALLACLLLSLTSLTSYAQRTNSAGKANMRLWGNSGDLKISGPVAKDLFTLMSAVKPKRTKPSPYCSLVEFKVATNGIICSHSICEGKEAYSCGLEIADLSKGVFKPLSQL
jgi:hypothetical protein